MLTADLADRLVPFEACFNFRDLGGYETTAGRSVAWGRLYRSDTLHRLTAADLVVFEQLGLSTVIDLRSTREIEDYGRLDESVVGLEWHHRPIIDRVALEPGKRVLPTGEEFARMEPGEGYFRYFGTGEAAVSVLGLIAASAGPAAFHCTSGKDRVGIIAALTLDLLGVPDETIVEDYLLTQQTRDQALAWIAEHEPKFAAFLDEIPLERRVMQPESIIGFLDRVRTAYGSVTEFVLSKGLTAAQVRQLQASLLA
jgi:protein-tyrosine phosphatase